jgi:hypothetical protein
MEELKPEELEELVQELEEEGAEEERLTPEVEELLQDLQSDSHYFDGEAAAEKLGKLDASNPRIVQALIVARKSGSHTVVRDAAAKALRAPVHQAVLQEHPQVIQSAERIVRDMQREKTVVKDMQPAEPALQQVPDLGWLEANLSKRGEGAHVQRRIYPQLRIQRRGSVSVIVGLVIVVGSIAWIVDVLLSADKSDCCSGLFVTVVCAIFAYAGFGGIGLDLLEIVRALFHCREWRGPQATTDGRIVDLESKKSRFEGEVFVTYWTTIAFSGTGGLVYLKAGIDQSTFRRLKRGDPVKVRYAVENPRLALLGWEE